MKKAVQFGAGNIGRGFIGALLSQSGYHVVFADVVDKIIDKINEDKTYTVHVMDVECEDQKIENISGVNSTKPEAVDEIASADLVNNSCWSCYFTSYRSYNRSSYRKNVWQTETKSR